MSTAPPVPVVTDFSQYAGMRAAAQKNDPKALRQAAQQFEAMFTEMMLKSAHETQFGDDLTGQQGQFYQDMFDQQLSMQMASGKGLGLADMLVRQLNGLHGGSAPASPSASASAGNSAGASVSSNAGVSGSTASAMPLRPNSVQEFVDAVLPEAQKAAAQLGVPTRALIAQAALETGFGKHVPRNADGSSANNLFGIKAQAGYGGSSTAQASAEYSNGIWSTPVSDFRSYGSIAQSFEDYVSFLKSNPRYAAALRAGSVSGFAQGLQNAGYATDPQYAQKLIKLADNLPMPGQSGNLFA
jgi:flagellar protein FlgJ